MLQGLATALYCACQTGLLLYSSHRWPMLVSRPLPSAGATPAWPEGGEPAVLVQLPVRDEPTVVARLVAAVAALDWPADRLCMQLLDDSDDPGAIQAGAAAVTAARSRGIAATHVRRGARTGFKAGALEHGLALDDSPFVAVFDADFLPAPDFLRRLMPRFSDEHVGLVQARWGHLNRDVSALTRAQAVMLDAHLLVEHPWRQRTGRFFNFNGTAGVWRRSAIESAGGWSHDTLTEDLDLSYRAQLAGWRFVFDPSVVVPAELPESMAAFRSQQHRWAKGALQTARKLLPRILRAPLPWWVRLEAVVHLTANAGYPLLLALAVLLAPVLFTVRTVSLPCLIMLQAGIVLLGTLPVILFLVRGQQLAGRSARHIMADVPGAMMLCAGLSWHLAGAVAAGLWGPVGQFVRTPKTGTVVAGARSGQAAGMSGRETDAGPARGIPELVLAASLALLACAAFAAGRPAAMPFLLVMSAGLAWVGLAMRPAAIVQVPAEVLRRR